MIFILLAALLLTACGEAPQCEFVAPLSGEPTDAVVLSSSAKVEAWSEDLVGFRLEDGTSVSVRLPTSRFELGGVVSVGDSVIVDSFSNLNVEQGNQLNARVSDLNGDLVFYVTNGGGRIEKVDEKSCTCGDSVVSPASVYLYSDVGDVKLASGEEARLVVDGREYVVQVVASYVDSESGLSNSTVAYRAVRQ